MQAPTPDPHELVQTPTEPERDLKRTVYLRKNNSMRNKMCICGSKKKFKKCCWSKYQ